VDLFQQLVALSQIILIDFVLAGDNAIVIGMAASRVAPHLRARVILWGMLGAVILRVLFALVATQLLAIVGLTFAGGILLLWVCWKMYREIALHMPQPAFSPAIPGGTGPAATLGAGAAVTQIIIADVSMSLDNVLAVAGAAKGDALLLAIGLTVAIGFMALLSTYIAKLLARYPWITWVGLLIVLYVALEMVWTGGHQVGCHFVDESTCRSGFLPTLGALLS
jgi:YjbE family integral membrane protein